MNDQPCYLGPEHVSILDYWWLIGIVLIGAGLLIWKHLRSK